MRITTLILAASLALAGGAVSAQTLDDRGVAPGPVVDGTDRLPGRAPILERDVFGTTDAPAGVIDGTNPNPNPTQAGGILSPERNGGIDTTGSIGR